MSEIIYVPTEIVADPDVECSCRLVYTSSTPHKYVKLSTVHDVSIYYPVPVVATACHKIDQSATSANTGSLNYK